MIQKLRTTVKFGSEGRQMANRKDKYNAIVSYLMANRFALSCCLGLSPASAQNGSTGGSVRGGHEWYWVAAI
jgi:hypothetical protein